MHKDLIDKWLYNELTVDDVREWLEKEPFADIIPEDCKEEFVGLILHTEYNYHNKIPCGGFISALLTDRLGEAVMNADRCNKLLISYYYIYFWNNAPADLFGLTYLK